MLQFVLANILIVSTGTVLYAVARTLPRIEPDAADTERKSMLERLIVSDIPEKIDAVFNSFLFKALRKLKVAVLKIDNVVAHHIKKVKPEGNGGAGDKNKPAIDFTEITGKNKNEEKSS